MILSQSLREMPIRLEESPQIGRLLGLLGQGVTRLRGDIPGLLRALPALGEVRVVTRNAHGQHEKQGQFGKISTHGPIAVVNDHDIDLRIFLDSWVHGFACEISGADGAPDRRLSFFDAAGQLVHQVMALAETDQRAWASLRAQFAAADQRPHFDAQPPRPVPPAVPDEAVDVAALRADWMAIEDAHDFNRMLRQKKLGRLQALRLAGRDLAWSVRADATWPMLREASATQTPIMVFLRNAGCIQIHTGAIGTVRREADFLTIRDPRFTLALHERAVAEAWVVRLPKAEGEGGLTGLELFDADGQYFCLFFGERHHGEAELPAWRAIIDRLETLP